MKRKSVLPNDVAKRKDVEDEKGWAEHRSLGDPTGDVMCTGFGVPQGNKLSSSSEVRVEPF